MSTENAPRYQPGSVWVIKIGSALLTDNGRGLAVDHVDDWVSQIAGLRRRQIQVVIVSSGAVAEGMRRLGMDSRPTAVHLLQAAASVGQSSLVQLYENHFEKHGIRTGQVLLTHADLRSRERYLNARSTLKTLLDLGVMPIINENDTVVTNEIRFGDNDTLAALVANLIEAQTLVLMTDQQGLFTGDPRKSSQHRLIQRADASDSSLDEMAGSGSALGRGGMVTKIQAARTAARSGANTLIVSGLEKDVIIRIAAGEVTGTLLTADREVLVSRKQWLAGLPAMGQLTLDDGAARVLKSAGRSLLPVGVTRVTGHFTRGEMVSCIDQSGLEICRGLVNYSHDETAAILGRSSSEIGTILGYLGDKELIHRDNLVLSF